MIKRYANQWAAQAFVAFIALALYGRTVTADFLRWDDRQNILLNPWIEHNILSLIWTRSYYNMYIPITYTFWDGLWHLDPNNPLQFHIANIVLHALNTVLVYLIARTLFGKEEKVGAVIAALVFACHPLQVEVVAWISCGRDLLATFFTLWACYLILRRDGWKTMAVTFVFFAIACLSKPSVAIVPVAMGLLLYAYKLLNRARLITLATWMVPAIGVTIATKKIQQLDADLRLTPMGLGDRLLVAVDTLSFYVQKFFVPAPLAADYGRTREMALDENIWIYGLIVIGVMLALIAVFRKRIPHRYLYFAAGFVLLLSPVLGVIPFQAQAQTTVADRYTYFPLISIGLLFGAMVGRQVKAGIAVAVFVLGSWCVMTFMRAGVWATNEGFFTDMLQKNEKSHVALSSLGVEYILTNRLPQAEDVLNRAAKLRPMDIIPRTNLAQLYLLENRPDRVVSEIAPLLDNAEFLRINQTETRALASAYRLVARANWGLDMWSRANDFYCRWFRLDYENEDGKAEVQRFIQDARKHTHDLPNCEFRPAN